MCKNLKKVPKNFYALKYMLIVNLKTSKILAIIIFNLD